MSLIENLKQSEGFNGMPYTDTEGYLTIGYGTKLPLNEKESFILLEYRAGLIKTELHLALPYLHLEQERWEILEEMAYQLGVPKLLKFKKMIIALSNEDYKLASEEMLDSKWARQMHEYVVRK